MNAPSLLEQMNAHPDVKVVTRTTAEGTTLHACNFTRRAFAEGRWNQLTTAARGLFLDADSRILGRGYEKFFNLGEKHGFADLEQFVDSALQAGSSTVLVRGKVNGYLGIITMLDGRVTLLSKAGLTPYADAGQEQLEKLLRTNQPLAQRLVQVLAGGRSVTVEVVLPNDPHLVVETPGLHLLDVLVNTSELVFDDHARRLLTQTWQAAGQPVATTSTVRLADLSAPQVAAVLDQEITLLTHRPEGAAEGAVLRATGGSQPVMTKVKGSTYRRRKSVRPLLERLASDQEPTARQRELAHALAEHLQTVDLTSYLITTPGGRQGVDIPRLLTEHPRLAAAIDRDQS